MSSSPEIQYIFTLLTIHIVVLCNGLNSYLKYLISKRHPLIRIFNKTFCDIFVFNGGYFWNIIPINQLKSIINTLIFAIHRRRHLQKIYLPFIILEISGSLSSSSPKIPFLRTSEKIFDDIWKLSLTIIGYFWYNTLSQIQL